MVVELALTNIGISTEEGDTRWAAAAYSGQWKTCKNEYAKVS